MLLLLDFRCEICDAEAEALVEKSVQTIPCECGREMKRLIAAPRIKLEGVTGHFPTAASKWERQHEKAGRQEPDR